MKSKSKVIRLVLLACSFGILSVVTAQTEKSDSLSRSMGSKMVLVEGGTYMYGLMRDATGQGLGTTVRTHQITVSSFLISKYEVTQAEWQSVMGDSLNLSYHQGCPNCPVEEVSWNDVQLFLRKLNALTGKHYQLPTEGQWEFAARGGNKSKGYKYAGSDNADEVASAGGEFTGQTDPVGSYHPNELGIYNMTGNVEEWCSDRFDPNDRPGPQTDPQGPSSGFGHVIRGGSWGVPPSGRQITSGRMGYANDRSAHVGFRLALVQ